MKLFQVVSCDLPAEYKNFTLFTSKKDALLVMENAVINNDNCGDNLTVVEYSLDLSTNEPQILHPLVVQK